MPRLEIEHFLVDDVVVVREADESLLELDCGCHEHPVYGFVAMADCPIHDKDKNAEPS